MSARDLQAIEAYVAENPDLKEGYARWKVGAPLLEWVSALFPGLEDRPDVRPYVLMNAIHAVRKDRGEMLRFALGKVSPAALSAADVDALDAVAFFGRMSLEELQILGI